MTSTPQNLPIAVVGMACRLPGAKDTREFWNMLVEGRSAIGPVPEQRLNRRDYYDPTRGLLGKTYVDQAALVDYSADQLPDSLISDQDLVHHDLAHTTLCRVTSEAFTDAGFSRSSLRGCNAGVYVGHATGSGRSGDYSYGIHIPQVADLLRKVEGFEQLTPNVRDAVVRDIENEVRAGTPRRNKECNPTFNSSEAANLIASKFQLDGPQMAFNSACASSLQALAHGMKALSLGRIDMAVVGGASCFHSNTLVLFSRAQSLSARGSFPFTDEADGLIVGEGYIVFVLKRLASAIADNDRVVAVLPSIGISSDGHGKSLWAPRSEGQIEAMKRAYPDKADIAGLQYIEAHATSTNLGDKTEIDAISQVLQDHLPAGKTIPIGGVKRNIGHTLEVAGAAGLLKVILAMQHGVIPPAVDSGCTLNPEIDWERLPIYVNDQPLAWPAATPELPRRAAVNAFGIGGLNVHVVVEEFHPSHRQTTRPSVAKLPAQATTPSSTSDQRSATDRSIAIVGIGLVLPGAPNLNAFRSMLELGQSAIGPFPFEKWNPDLFADPHRLGDHSIRLPGAGSVADFAYDWRKHRIPPKQVAQANPLQFMMLDAVDQAFQHSGLLDHNRFDRKKAGCIVGTQFGGDFSTQLVMALRLPETRKTALRAFAKHGVSPDMATEIVDQWTQKVIEHFPAIVDESGSFTASALASRVTKSFDLMGGGVAIDANEMAAFAALSGAVDMLLTESCDTMICVAGQHSLLPESFLVSDLSGSLATSIETGCPFDASSNGTILGAGCVALVLMRLEDARRDGHQVLGIVEGIGTSNTGDRIDAVQRSVQRALSDAGLSADQTSGIESVGCGVGALDAAEVAGLSKVYGMGQSATGGLPLSTPVAQVGNLGSASGLVSLVAALCALDNESLPPPSQSFRPTEAVLHSTLSASSQPQPLKTSNEQGKLYVGLHGCSLHENSYHVILQRGEPVTPQPVSPTSTPHQQSASHPQQAERLPNGVLMFDATARRREKMRQAAGAASRGNRPGVPVRQAASPPVASPPTSPAPGLSNAISQPNAVAPARPLVTPNPPVNLPPTSVPTQAAPVVTTTTEPDAANQLAPEEVKSFLISFVMEQTGYPREIVDLDADLEADLGIDSIKKAQLFGELGEYFDVQASSDLSLDAFPTLRTVMQYLLDGASGNDTVTQPVATPQSVPSPTAAPVNTPVAVEATPVAASDPVSSGTGLQGEEVETFLINFVMEQTGYPREIVDLDADLEADLGIDSIKKAQLFGELGEYFDVQASSDLSLDAFPTLRTVMQYLLDGAASDAPAAQPTAVPQADAHAVAAPAITAAAAAPAASPVSSGDAGSSDSLKSDEIETFLINFVMEQTGYPREIVDLDADLEADLGIDSIKKAQLFGELGEYFDVQASTDLSLDAFPTLRTVMAYLQSDSSDQPTASSDIPESTFEQAQAFTTDAAKLASTPAVPVDVESFVIATVMDQTGYPREVIDLDGDFEIDLGLDDLKRLELLTYLSTHCSVPSLASGNFTTLRNVIDFLVHAQTAGNLSGQVG